MGIKLSQHNAFDKLSGRKNIDIQLFVSPQSTTEKTVITKMISEAIRKGEDIIISRYKS